MSDDHEAARSSRRRGPRTARMLAMLAAAAAAAILVAGLAYGQLPGPLNDLFALGQGGGDSPAAAPVATRAEPPLAATPLVPCGPGSRPEPGVDGRVPAGSATERPRAATSRSSATRAPRAASRCYRYVDAHGHDCAFYDTTLMFPLNALNPGGGSVGVAVLDMSDPAHPVQTDTLTALPMLSPHESLNLNAKRGPARRGERQPDDRARARRDLRRPRRLPPSRARSRRRRSRASGTRAASPPTARPSTRRARRCRRSPRST